MAPPCVGQSSPWRAGALAARPKTVACPRCEATVGVLAHANHVLLPADTDAQPGWDLRDRLAAVRRDAHRAPPPTLPAVGGPIDLRNRSFRWASPADGDRPAAPTEVAEGCLGPGVPRCPPGAKTAAAANPGLVGAPKTAPASHPGRGAQERPPGVKTAAAHHRSSVRRCCWDGWAQLRLARAASRAADLPPGH